jgi:hypothetical protein
MRLNHAVKVFFVAGLIIGLELSSILCAAETPTTPLAIDEARVTKLFNQLGQTATIPPVAEMTGSIFWQKVAWKDYHDINTSTLKDGRRFHLDLTHFGWEKINAWKPEKTLYLCYGKALGATLFDPESHHHFPIQSSWRGEDTPWHPLDDYATTLAADSTLEMMQANDVLETLWKFEIDRCVQDVLQRPLPADVRQKFLELAQARLHYCHLQISFASQAIHTDITGTAAGPITGAYATKLYRQAYFQLTELAQYYQAFGPPQRR